MSQSAIVTSLGTLQITRIVVAHRLSTIERADQIIVLGSGVVVQQGAFDELTAQEGPFRDLVERQRL